MNVLGFEVPQEALIALALVLAAMAAVAAYALHSIIRGPNA